MAKKFLKQIVIIFVNSAIQAPSSIGLEAWRVLDFRGKKAIEDLQKNGTNGDQPKNPSDILVWITHKQEWTKDRKNTKLVENILPMTKSAAEMRGVKWDKKIYDMFVDYVYGDVKPELHINNEQYYKKQTYIALGYALLAAEERGVKTTPVEGFNVKKFEAWARKNKYISENEVFAVAMYMGYVDKDIKSHIPKRIRSKLEDKLEVIE